MQRQQVGSRWEGEREGERERGREGEREGGREEGNTRNGESGVWFGTKRLGFDFMMKLEGEKATEEAAAQREAWKRFLG
jgi:hypothetical protein